MADKLTDRTALTTRPAESDVLHVVDVSDTTDSAEGTSKQVAVSNLLGGMSMPKRVSGYEGYIVIPGLAGNTDGDAVQIGDILIGKGVFAGGNMIMAVANTGNPTTDAHLDFYVNGGILP